MREQGGGGEGPSAFLLKQKLHVTEPDRKISHRRGSKGVGVVLYRQAAMLRSIAEALQLKRQDPLVIGAELQLLCLSFRWLPSGIKFRVVGPKLRCLRKLQSKGAVHGFVHLQPQPWQARFVAFVFISRTARRIRCRSASSTFDSTHFPPPPPRGQTRSRLYR